MNKNIEISSLVNSDSITIYWEKIYRLQDQFVYELFLNNSFIGQTNKTHFTFNDLDSETQYMIQVKVRMNESEVIELTKKIEIMTKATKERMDISKAPYYAVGDGKTLNTEVIQKAIDDCQENQCVYIPKGTFMTGALKLHSNMELFLEEGAILQGTDNPRDYLPLIHSRFEGIERTCYSSLLNMGELDSKAGFNCKNVVIRGKGTISSGGKKLSETIIAEETDRLKDYLQSLGDKINEYEKPETIAGRVRPRLINMSNCENIILSGLNLENGASWNIHMIYSNNIITHDCYIYSKGIWNGDGWDPDSSTNCTIFNCRFNTHDDAIAIKSGKNPEGNEINRPCEHINIFDITLINGHGIAIGSEISGGINDIKIWDCDLKNSIFGFEIKGTKKRGAFVKNISVKDLVAPRIHMHSVTYNDDGMAAATSPDFSTCCFEDVLLTGKYVDYEGISKTCEAIELIGFDEEYKVKDITFKNVKLSGNQKVTLEYCENITFGNVSCI